MPSCSSTIVRGPAPQVSTDRRLPGTSIMSARARVAPLQSNRHRIAIARAGVNGRRMEGLRSRRWSAGAAQGLDAVLGHVFEKLPRLAVEGAADGVERRQPQAPDLAGLEQREIGLGDADRSG